MPEVVQPLGLPGLDKQVVILDEGFFIHNDMLSYIMRGNPNLLTCSGVKKFTSRRPNSRGKGEFGKRTNFENFIKLYR